MIRIGFSTSRAWYSRLIRRWTGSRVSHTFLILEILGKPMVLEEGALGFAARALEQMSRSGSQIVHIVTPRVPIDDGVVAALDDLGQRYDYFGLLGMALVMIARRIGHKIRNPLASSKAMFCSERNVRVLQAAGYPGADALDPSATTPEDLLEFLQSEAA